MEQKLDEFTTEFDKILSVIKEKLKTILPKLRGIKETVDKETKELPEQLKGQPEAKQ